MLVADDKLRFLQQLQDSARERLAGMMGPALTCFCETLAETFPLEDMRGRQFADVFGAVHDAWMLLQQRGEQAVNLTLYNPHFERDGWQCPHTVLLLVCRDMPFVRDSVRLEMQRRGIAVHVIYSVPLRLRRDAAGQLTDLAGHDCDPAGRGSYTRETLLYMEFSRHSLRVDLDALRDELLDVLNEVRTVVFDFNPMVERVAEVRRLLAVQTAGDPALREDIDEFLHWVSSRHFTFLGADVLQVDYVETLPRVILVEGSSLGVLRLRESLGVQDLQRELVQLQAPDALLRRQITFARSSVRARVHRQAYPLYIGVKHFHPDGRLAGEYRFLGLFTSAAYAVSPFRIPLLRRKLDYAQAESGFDPRSHDGREFQRVLEIFPRDELFQCDPDELLHMALAIHRIQERRLVRLFVREDYHRKFISCLVYTPRDVYRTEVRTRIERLLGAALGAHESEFNTYFSESMLTRTHFIFRVDPDREQHYDIARLEQEIRDVAQRWEERLEQALLEEMGEEEGSRAANLYREAFPPGYQADFEPRIAVGDIRRIATLENGSDIAMTFYRAMEDAGNTVRLRVFHRDSALALSDMLPILENLGLRVLSERAHCIRARQQPDVWLHEFSLVYSLAESFDVDNVRVPFLDAFERIWRGEVENDAFNRLILGTRLGWREVALLRAYARYMKQLAYPISEAYIAETLGQHLALTENLVALFRARFDPALPQDDEQRLATEHRKETRILLGLDAVSNLNEDRIIRLYVALLKNTLRTNAFVRDASGEPRPYFAFKFSPRELPDIPEPRPLYEIFVYSPRMEGVHLRGGRVARGGIRWSDRLEDFRTEVLGLMKAQQVKNAVIVPVGAKGGFVAKCLPRDGGREALQAEGIACYRLFISGLLDLTDNIVEGRVVPPAAVLRKDGDDPYLVVAADKGTATFSDIANQLSLEHGFWLGDAFASGGSVGYDHKKMGITARGAWVSVQRHFRELGIDERQPFTAVGIGDMSGDVFGNGLLRSPNLRLVAAFNHQHIFIDPEPDPARSFVERERLFRLPRSSWVDYDAMLISEGGGVFSRQAKSIVLSPRIRTCLDVQAEQLTPAELVKAILRAPVDLLWNGGIGTYVKSSEESHAEVGDKNNDPVRIDACELRARVVGEGGNLGMTQLARVEYSLAGGRCNADFIDNAGGVNCSDHEVNIKILLNEVMAAGDMTDKQRRALLQDMTDDVAALVLADNYLQVQAISLAQREAPLRLGEYRRFMLQMESRGRLNRALEFLPDEDTLNDRRANGLGLTRPELALLICYAKAELKDLLADPRIEQDEYLDSALYEAFPARIHEQFPALLRQHRLRRELVATQIANDLVNHMGVTFVSRLEQSTGASAVDVARAYVVARDVFRLEDYWAAVQALDGAIDADLQLQLMQDAVRLGRRASRWFLRNRRRALDCAAEVARFRPGTDTLREQLPDALCGPQCQSWEDALARLEGQGVPARIAHDAAGMGVLYSALGIIEACEITGQPLSRVATLYFALGRLLELDWFARQLAGLKIDSYWQARARESYQDDVEWQQRALAIAVLQEQPPELSADDALARWAEVHAPLLARWRGTLAELQAADTTDTAIYAVALRELLDLAQASTYCGGVLPCGDTPCPDSP